MKAMTKNISNIMSTVLCVHSSPIYMPYSRVPLVKMVAPAPLAQLDPEASLVILDSPVLRDLL